MSATYSCPLRMTQQFKFCPNPFRIDMYKGCDFGCSYCFSNTNASAKFSGFAEAKIQQLEKYFTKAFDSDAETEDIITELLRHRVPFHCGGMSDPFQTREWSHELTYKLIALSNKYDYPILFSTKTAYLPDKYFEILNPAIHAFHSSICGWSDDFIHKWEGNTATAYERLNFGKQLRDKGFWWGLRIQPLIDMNEAEQLIINVKDIPNYITIEHIKLPNDNVKLSRVLYEKLPDSFKDVRHSNLIFRNLEINTSIKRKNIEYLQCLANKNGVPVGVGDNDLHYMSQSRCCCGLDLINDNFSNYLKYNMTYMSTGAADSENFKDLWIPQQNCKSTFNSKTYRDKKVVNFKEVVDEYILKHDNMLPDKYRKNIEKQIFNIISNRLI